MGAGRGRAGKFQNRLGLLNGAHTGRGELKTRVYLSPSSSVVPFISRRDRGSRHHREQKSSDAGGWGEGGWGRRGRSAGERKYQVLTRSPVLGYTTPRGTSQTQRRWLHSSPRAGFSDREKGLKCVPLRDTLPYAYFEIGWLGLGAEATGLGSIDDSGC